MRKAEASTWESSQKTKKKKIWLLRALVIIFMYVYDFMRLLCNYINICKFSPKLSWEFV